MTPVPDPSRLREMAAELVALAEEMEGRGVAGQAVVQATRVQAGNEQVRSVMATVPDPAVNGDGIEHARDALRRRGGV